MAEPLETPRTTKRDRGDHQEFSVATHGWWVTSRPYRVMWELILYSLLSVGVLVYVISRTSDVPAYRVLDVLQPLYVIGIFSGALGGAARGLLAFWKRNDFNMLRRHYWKHCMPFYLGVTFGFLITLILQSGLKVIGIEHNIADSGGMSFVAMICMLSGFLADRAEKRLVHVFDSAFGVSGGD